MARPLSSRTAPATHGQHGLTRTEVVVILAIGLLLVSVFVIMLPHMRVPDRPIRTVCAANLKGIGTALYTYANENNGMWPVALHALAEQDGVGKVTYAPNKIGMKRTGVYGVASAPSQDGPAAGGSTIGDTELSTTRNLWVLVRANALTPSFFICPSSDDAKNDDDNPQLFYDFRKYSEVSYGYQVPYGRKGRPSADCNPRMPLVADKGPFGAALEAGKLNPGVPSVAASASPDDWQKWNSPNHAGEGQVVLFPDGHADFHTKPTCGVNNDNIYTRWSGAEGELQANESARAHGIPPTGRETPWSDTDTLVYP